MSKPLGCSGSQAFGAPPSAPFGMPGGAVVPAQADSPCIAVRPRAYYLCVVGSTCCPAPAPPDDENERGAPVQCAVL